MKVLMRIFLVCVVVPCLVMGYVTERHGRTKYSRARKMLPMMDMSNCIVKTLGGMERFVKETFHDHTVLSFYNLHYLTESKDKDWTIEVENGMKKFKIKINYRGLSILDTDQVSGYTKPVNLTKGWTRLELGLKDRLTLKDLNNGSWLPPNAEIKLSPLKFKRVTLEGNEMTFMVDCLSDTAVWKLAAGKGFKLNLEKNQTEEFNVSSDGAKLEILGFDTDLIFCWNDDDEDGGNRPVVMALSNDWRCSGLPPQREHQLTIEFAHDEPIQFIDPQNRTVLYKLVSGSVRQMSIKNQGTTADMIIKQRMHHLPADAVFTDSPLMLSSELFDASTAIPALIGVIVILVLLIIGIVAGFAVFILKQKKPECNAEEKVDLERKPSDKRKEECEKEKQKEITDGAPEAQPLTQDDSKHKEAEAKENNDNN